MNIVRFDPFRDMAVLQDRVNRVFGDLSRRFDDDVAARGAWVPAVDIFENDQHELVLKAELPDLKREDIDIRGRGSQRGPLSPHRADLRALQPHLLAAEHGRHREDRRGIQERRSDREAAEARRRPSEADSGPNQLG